LRQIQTVIADGVENQILEFIDYSKQILAKGCHLVVLGVDEDPVAERVQSRRSVVASTSFEMRLPRCAPKE
jgi:archaellum biogenesis ATPase FlaH